ncbi:MAG: hypothetical protein HQ509_06385 [Candidatus Marinimicrobia bacterium]|nr:hypothetical protein [Candidatus Neomarinimicrobiota bacterium]
MAVRIKYLFVIVMGIFFALLQTCYFFQLEIWLTAAYPSFLTITMAWLLGNVVGLRLISDKTDSIFVSRRLWVILSVIAYYSVLGLLHLFPYQMNLLPVYGVLIGVSGVMAGRFFVRSRSIFESSSRLFLMENNGFILGWIIGFLGFVRFGISFNLFAPLIFGICCYVLIVSVSSSTKG